MPKPRPPEPEPKSPPEPEPDPEPVPDDEPEPSSRLVTAETPMRGIGDAPRAAWEAELRRLNSPMLPELDAILAAARPHGAMALAQAARESTYGTAANARQTRNAWGLMVRGSIPSRLQTFSSWAAAAAEFSRRLSNPAPPYDPENISVRDYLLTYVGGPLCRQSGGRNCANGETGASIGRYEAALLAQVNAVLGADEPPPVSPPQPPKPPAIDLPLRTWIAENAGANRPRRPLLGNDLWITVHETGNPNPGATAAMHRTFVNDGGGPEGVSFHLAVDDLEAIQILPFNEIGYHAGDGCNDPDRDIGCFRSVAIETAVNAPLGSAGWAKALRNLAALIALLVTEPGRFEGGAGKRFSFERIAPHRQWSGKDCPQRMLAGGLLPGVVAEAKAIAGGAPEGGEPKPPKPDALTLALFPEANVTASGVVTKAWLKARQRDDEDYPFIRSAPDGEGGIFWIFGGLVLRSKGSTVTEVET